MRFSPHRTVASNSLGEIEAGYDSLSSSDEDEEQTYLKSSPFLIQSSPIKSSLLDQTPSKSARSHYRKIHSPIATFHSSPLSKSIDYSFLDGDNSLNTVDDLSELFKDLKFKERYLLVKQQSFNKGSKSKSSKLNPSLFTKRSSSIHQNSSPISRRHIDFTDDESDTSFEWKQPSSDFLAHEESQIIDGLESRLSQRSKGVDDKIKQIVADKKRREEEKRRLEEEERLKKEELERLRKEQEERKRKEEEAKKLEAEKKAKEEAERLKKQKEEEEREKLKQEQILKEEAAKKEKLGKEQAAQNAKGITNYGEVEKEFLQHKETIKTIKSTIVEPVKKDLATKNAILKHKRKINPKFGQLTNSLSQLSRISNEVIQLIDETKASEIAYKWILNFVSKALVSQAETEVRAKPSSSLPIAKLTLNLLCEFPEMKEYLLARFVKKCPFVMGYTCSIDTEEGRLKMGWKRHEDSKWEDEVSYDERMSGIMTLYSVLTRLALDGKYFNNLKHPLPLTESWKLLARLLNLPSNLLTNAHFIVASAWWEGAANEFLMNYGKQGVKILQILWTKWPESVKDKKFTGANTLQAIGDDWSGTGVVKNFNEMEP